MTTFQYLVEAFIATLSSVLPIPRSLTQDIATHLLHWDAPSTELLTLVGCTVGTYLIYFFRYDFLGILSALIKSIIKPTSIAGEHRTLDQHILLFILIVLPFAYLGNFYLANELTGLELEILKSPIAHAVAYLAVAGGFQFSKNWNKRIKGLNHLKLSDALLLGSLSLLTAYDPVSWVAVLWIGLALTNYHFEAIFKYASILITIMIVFATVSLVRLHTPMEALQHVGYLNGIALVAVSLTTIYMLVEHLQRTMSEGTYKNSRNWCILCAVFYCVLVFL